MNPEAFSELVASRHSVRDFRADPVPPEVIEEILEDARQAPSWSNTRPFMVALATGEQAPATILHRGSHRELQDVSETYRWSLSQEDQDRQQDHVSGTS